MSNKTTGVFHSKKGNTFTSHSNVGFGGFNSTYSVRKNGKVISLNSSKNKAITSAIRKAGKDK